MKIDGNLRQAIRSACNAQSDIDWTEVQRQITSSIQSFVDSPKGKRAKAIVKKLRALYAESRILEKELCSDFGLRVAIDKVEIGSCDNSKERYRKAGGTLPEKKQKWNFDSKMAEVAGASEPDAIIILRQIGINWQ
jgi:hypothetical protein